MDDVSPTTPLISVVIPLYNEGSHLRELLADLKTALQETGCRFEVVLVDDGSSDDTWAEIKDEARMWPDLRAIRLSRNFGKELALCAGLERARGNAVIVMDGDGQHPPSLLPLLIETWRTSGADIVEAVKRRRGRESLASKFGALTFYVILNKLSGFDLKGASDFKLIDRRVLDTWLAMRERNVFFRGMTAWMGFRTIQIPFEVASSSCGQIGVVLPQAREACSDWDNDFFILPAAPCDVCRSDLFYLCGWFGDPDALPETGRSRLNRFRHRNSTGTHHWQSVDDQPRYHWRISRAHLRRG